MAFLSDGSWTCVVLRVRDQSKQELVEISFTDDISGSFDDLSTT